MLHMYNALRLSHGTDTLHVRLPHNPPTKLVGSGVSTPCTLFCLICAINSELNYFPIFNDWIEPGSISASIRYSVDGLDTRWIYYHILRHATVAMMTYYRHAAYIQTSYKHTTRTNSHSHTRLHVYWHTRINTHTQSHTHIHACIYARMYAYTAPFSHTHISHN